jgi:hypothetical protein
MKHDLTAILRRISGHARVIRDCAQFATLCEPIKPLSRKELAIVKSTVKTHARLMVEWAKKLP